MIAEGTGTTRISLPWQCIQRVCRTGDGADRTAAARARVA
jgi:hypothetical protein